MTEGIFLHGVFTGLESRTPKDVTYWTAGFAVGAKTFGVSVQESVAKRLESVQRFTEVTATLELREYKGDLRVSVVDIVPGRQLAAAGLPAAPAASSKGA
jgi:hypothetical protein